MSVRLAAAAALLVTYQFGYNIGIVSPALVYMEPDLELPTAWKPFLVSASLFGALAGCFPCAHIAHRYGRRKAMVLLNIVFLASVLCCVLTNHWALVLLGRFLTGLAMGGATSVVPVYITEISPSNRRGWYGTLVQFSISSGVISAYLVGWGVSANGTGEGLWRWMLGSSVLLPTLSLMMLPFMFESPRWIQERQGRISDITVAQDSEKSPLISETPPQQHTASVVELSLMKQPYRGRFLMAIALHLLQQLSGINIIVFYSGKLLKQWGFSRTGALFISSVTGIPQLFILVLTAWLQDRIGRRPLLFYSAAGMAVGMTCAGAFATQSQDWTRWAIFFSFLLCRMSYAIGMGPGPSLVATELLPQSLRQRAMGWVIVGQWTSNVLVTTLSGWLIEWNVIQWFLLFCGAFCASGALWIRLKLIETRDFSLDDDSNDESVSAIDAETQE